LKKTNKETQINDVEDAENQSKALSVIDDTLIVIGIGSSAGGLEALQLMATALPKSTQKLCYVVAQHLSPTFKSMMNDLLKNVATLPVSTAVNGMHLKADHIYVCPPDHNIELKPHNIISLTKTKPAQTNMPKPSVDLLFESIAICKRDLGIGIVLSGTGSDGARGLRAIKGEGGIVIVQDPQTAKFNGMPQAAIDAGNIDCVLAPEQIGNKLADILSFPRLSTFELGNNEIPIALYRSIIKAIFRTVNIDFNLYKESTILRRIDRRMVTLKIKNPEEYFQYLQKNTDEAEFLFRDILIGVTSFFRDMKAFAALKQRLIKLIANKDESDKLIRIWVVGCSTGEEAYSIAMLLSEILDHRIVEYKIQMFATDIDIYALETARAGIYPESSLNNVPAALRKKYFKVKGDRYEVDKAIKSMILFSRHNLIADPPFLKLDLISCRNLLIYFSLELQKLVMPLFHYSLKDSGSLFLGKSESVGVFHEYFKPIDRALKIFEALYLGRKMPPAKLSSSSNYAVNTKRIEDKTSNKLEFDNTVNSKPTLADVAALAVKKMVLPNSIVINENMDIIYSQGDNPFLIRPEGEPTNNVFKNMLPILSAELRAAVHIVNQDSSVFRSSFQKMTIANENKFVRLIVSNAPVDLKLGKLYIIFIQTEDELQVPITQPELMDYNEVSNALVKEQERQIVNIRTQLQTVIEELESSNEEMQSLNEELQSSNEELQSSNEELETTNEELQSTNEELQTAYTELRLAYEEKEHQKLMLERTKDELKQAAEMVFDAEKMGRTGSWMMNLAENRKMLWSNGCFNLLGLSEKEYNPTYEALVGLTCQEDRAELEQYFEALFDGKPSSSIRVRCNRGVADSVWIELTAYVSFNDMKKPVKVLGNMFDVTESMMREQEKQSHRDLVRRIIGNSLTGIYLYDFNTQNYTYINDTYTHITGYSKDEMSAMNKEQFAEIFKADKAEERLSHLNTVQQSKDGEMFTYEYELKAKSGEYITLRSSDSVFERNEQGEAISMIGSFSKSDNTTLADT